MRYEKKAKQLIVLMAVFLFVACGIIITKKANAQHIRTDVFNDDAWMHQKQTVNLFDYQTAYLLVISYTGWLDHPDSTKFAISYFIYRDFMVEIGYDESRDIALKEKPAEEKEVAFQRIIIDFQNNFNLKSLVDRIDIMVNKEWKEQKAKNPNLEHPNGNIETLAKSILKSEWSSYFDDYVEWYKANFK